MACEHDYTVRLPTLYGQEDFVLCDRYTHLQTCPDVPFPNKIGFVQKNYLFSQHNVCSEYHGLESYISPRIFGASDGLAVDFWRRHRSAD